MICENKSSNQNVMFFSEQPNALDLLSSIVMMTFYPHKVAARGHVVVHDTIPSIDIGGPIATTLTIFPGTATFVPKLSVFVVIAVS